MNIKEAKQEIKNTISAYLKKDALGMYLIPVEKQRPILLMGPPGVGKTQIMEQVARECGINLVSYTITHHTRQSAIGLPFIRKENFGGREYSVTEYTMSEIVASVYRQIQLSGKAEGILFLDEINCVSETLSPVMLQFLQYKTFGTHKLPEGFVVVTAGNPHQYNKSVRDFDIVTLDRVKRIDIQENFDVWKEYAYSEGVHGSILSYLEIKKEHFFRVQTQVEGRRFVTARGWEDLSRTLQVYEDLGLPISREFIQEYVQDPEISGDFALYYELYKKYKDVYRIPDILEGRYEKAAFESKKMSFDEKIGLISHLTDSISGENKLFEAHLFIQEEIYSLLKEIPTSGISSYLNEQRQKKEKDLSAALEAGMLSREEEKRAREVLSALESLLSKGADEIDSEKAKNWFRERESRRQEEIQTAENHLTNAFHFMKDVFGEGQEMVMFLTELSRNRHVLFFVQETGHKEYYRYNRLLMVNEQREELKKEILERNLL